MCLGILEKFHLIDVKRDVGEDKEFIEINNLTLINFVLRLAGPTNEKILTVYILVIQVTNIFIFLNDVPPGSPVTVTCILYNCDTKCFSCFYSRL